MKCSVLLLSAVLCFSASKVSTQAAVLLNGPQTSIVNGEDVPETLTIKYHVHLHMGVPGEDVRFGSGAYIGTTFVLTVAQNILPGITDLKCGFGNRNVNLLTWVEAVNYIVHQDYNATNLDHNIAIIQLGSDPTDINIKPIPMADSETPQLWGVVGTVFGFGFTSNDGNLPTILQQAAMTMQGVAVCVDAYPLIMTGRFLNSFCAVNVVSDEEEIPNICVGDIGGPFVSTPGWVETLMGLSSFYHSDDCFSGMPAGFVRVSFYRSWIYSITFL